MRKKILFIINGLGLGNSTRCSAIIDELINLNFEIDVITSSNGTFYFNQIYPQLQVFNFKSILYGQSKGQLSILKTILALPAHLMKFLHNISQLRTIVSKNSYAAIVFDSDYTAIGLPKNNRPLLIGLNNAALIVQEGRKLQKIPKNIRLQFAIEHLDAWFHAGLPDIVLCPVYKPILHPKPYLKLIPPIVRKKLSPSPPRDTVKNILIMLSGSQFGSEITFTEKLTDLANLQIHVLGRNGPSYKNIRYHGKMFNNEMFLQLADILVINGGFSAVSEALLLGKPTLVIPINNHAEQFVNAQFMEEIKMGLMATESNLESKLLELIENYPMYLRQGVNSLEIKGSAQHAAKIISQVITDKDLPK